MNKIKSELQLLLSKAEIIKELFGFLASNKLWWAIPIILVTVLLVVLLMLGQSSGVPFIYPFF